MKKILLALLVLTSTACTSVSNGSYETYSPFNTDAGYNCAVESSDIYLINGVPSLKYICNKVK
ncbi:hypothetical protein pEaSNUABM50_00126 [Erwinia phage pEa_SNUABM_50]|uniref:Lipoprotein n=4 Tax=Eneladusvirus BF TaxID=2560751 RepID=A0A7L8ZNV1_9CAUD|nr:hypothetical protein FDH34_gp128 [Serratia phage BF]QOI71066.1 putative adenine-specific DNA methylase [Erwinia phage pEa_SNUABM_12]QOI71611.1 hypothetical protein pEaSNUABM47_00127 [Erwinia phage pEa_SNUABM_47]QOI72150.1 hypothetical protein pEaSNUABM50_00126 [Erwinia phage pEa_SNUABM_50]QXO11275.1 hypothetical protein pEaSNUABM19_00129 [Erwinia phage pEa_SNUABM_19]QXO11823.1 hypothetical protein pEaSNUABM44_00127 [Erwinia phage pEa_SNUABM_44]QXO12375.1 hypothetical protein pEaSNUABM49_00